MGESTPEQRDGEPCPSCGELVRWDHGYEACVCDRDDRRPWR